MVFSIFLMRNMRSLNSYESDLAWHLNKHKHATHARVINFFWTNALKWDTK